MGGRWLIVLVALSGCAPSASEVPRTLRAGEAGTVHFSPDGVVVLSGVLRFPNGAGRVAAVILMHGCGGVGNADAGWVPPLRDAGFATLVVDSFSGRGLREVCTNALKLSANDRIPDAYAALKLLATHPRVDRDRIVLMGFSHGGIVTLRSATTWARDRYGAGGPGFRVFLPFYPLCSVRYPELLRLAGPVRIHSGELDDWTPAAPCAELVKDMKAAGNDADITIYRGAHHSFDNIGLSITHLPNVDSGAACRINATSFDAPPVSRLPECVRKGATLGWSPAATAAARKNVLAQLATLLR